MDRFGVNIRTGSTGTRPSFNMKTSHGCCVTLASVSGASLEINTSNSSCPAPPASSPPSRERACTVFIQQHQPLHTYTRSINSCMYPAVCTNPANASLAVSHEHHPTGYRIKSPPAAPSLIYPTHSALRPQIGQAEARRNLPPFPIPLPSRRRVRNGNEEKKKETNDMNNKHRHYWQGQALAHLNPSHPIQPSNHPSVRPSIIHTHPTQNPE